MKISSGSGTIANPSMNGQQMLPNLPTQSTTLTYGQNMNDKQ
jgi:hypothetical protein